MERDLGLRLATEEATRKLFPASGDAREVRRGAVLASSRVTCSAAPAQPQVSSLLTRLPLPGSRTRIDVRLSQANARCTLQ
jgi:hypothetical protein